MSNFDDRAPEWDTPERQQRALVVAAAIRSAVPLTQATRMIEVGAGTGLLGLALAGDVGEVVLAEPSQGMLAVAREKLADRAYSHVSAVPFDLLADPPPGGPFDLAVSLLVLHHLADTRGALGAVRELLLPGGRMALADLDEENGSFHGPDAEGIHHRGFARAHLLELARAVGFVDVAIQTATELQREGRRYPVFLLLGRRPSTG
jgi:SAM-dependent methyltransferase